MYGVFLAIGDRRERARARAVVERERGFRLVGEAGDGATAFAGASRGWNRSSWARATTRCSPAR